VYATNTNSIPGEQNCGNAALGGAKELHPPIICS
jgi:hypothetical protein